MAHLPGLRGAAGGARRQRRVRVRAFLRLRPLRLPQPDPVGRGADAHRRHQGDGRGARAIPRGGHYAPIAAAVAERVADGVANGVTGGAASRADWGVAEGSTDGAVEGTGDASPAAPFVVEIGSGTGYYLAAAAARLRERGRAPTAALGIDLGKDAADLAARRHPDLGFVVADAQDRVPVADASVAAVLSVFAPRPAAEMTRVLRPGGTLVVAFAGPRHLAALRARLGLMDVHADKLETLIERLGEAFEPVGEELIERAVVLDRDAAESVVLMGPNARHDVDLGRLDDGLEDTISVRVASFRRSGD